MPKILLVEDDETLSKMYQKKLELEGFEIEVAFSGTEGIEKATTTSPDLILLDIMLPGVDGFGVIREIQKVEKAKHIPIIILTNLGTSDVFIDEAKILGVKKYLIKYKTSVDELVKVVREELGKI